MFFEAINVILTFVSSLVNHKCSPLILYKRVDFFGLILDTEN